MLYRELNALQIRVTLAEIEPAVWRRLVVPLPWHLGQLHLAIQAAFNWWNAHLHEFRIGGLRYGDLDNDDMTSDDGPRHTVQIEELLALDTAPRLATCTDGAKARPPEDIGGGPGYEAFLDIIADPRHPEHTDTKRWCGGHFDPKWFDLATVDKDVKNALKPNVQRRLYQPKPKSSDRTS